MSDPAKPPNELPLIRAVSSLIYDKNRLDLNT